MNNTTDQRDSSTPSAANQPNTTHPLYGMSEAARIESRQRVLAKAMAEILLASRRESNAIATETLR